ncbi:MAG: hypothetical protein GOVbin1454_18 [Prokaryotic dsDNA virus sp.]|nr:MAG: hypothetical protein GOVbin1454_18 [Prokaryotic dsDNA virus sp.]|tara:strand:- start:3 stop:590 length:588 start_codon:yes stop_codon:yes gene_type:complete
MKATEENKLAVKAWNQMAAQTSGYRLMVRAEEIIQELWGSEGELTGLIRGQIEDFFNESDSKLDQYRYVREVLIGKAERAKKNMERFRDLRKQCENEIARIGERALGLMEARMEVDEEKGRRFQSDHGLVFVSKRQSLEIDDEKAFIELWLKNDPSLITETVTHKIDKIALKSALKNGRKIEGARLVEKLGVTFK